MTPHYDLKQQEKKKQWCFEGWAGKSQIFLSYIWEVEYFVPTGLLGGGGGLSSKCLPTT